MFMKCRNAAAFSFFFYFPHFRSIALLLVLLPLHNHFWASKIPFSSFPRNSRKNGKSSRKEKNIARSDAATSRRVPGISFLFLCSQDTLIVGQIKGKRREGPGIPADYQAVPNGVKIFKREFPFNLGYVLFPSLVGNKQRNRCREKQLRMRLAPFAHPFGWGRCVCLPLSPPPLLAEAAAQSFGQSRFPSPPPSRSLHFDRYLPVFASVAVAVVVAVERKEVCRVGCWFQRCSFKISQVVTYI